MPRIFGVQPEGSASVANAFFAGTEEIKPVKAVTIADSVSVDMPNDGLRALRAATQTGGRYITVTDEHILKAIARHGFGRHLRRTRGSISLRRAGERGDAQGFIDPRRPGARCC